MLRPGRLLNQPAHALPLPLLPDLGQRDLEIAHELVHLAPAAPGLTGARHGALPGALAARVRPARRPHGQREPDRAPLVHGDLRRHVRAWGARHGAIGARLVIDRHRDGRT